MFSEKRKTIKMPIGLSGVGVHSGQDVVILLKPDMMGQGIRFRVGSGPEFKAHLDHVIDSRSATTLGLSQKVRLTMVEHLLAACYGLGVTDLKVIATACEMPILDGSARIYGEFLEQAGLQELDQEAPHMIIRKPFVFQSQDQLCVVMPGNAQWEAHVPLGSTVQVYQFNPQEQNFMKEISPARTFVQRKNIEALRQAGYIKGGSLDCALVLDGDQPLNGGYLSHECARHKILDMMGDFFLVGAFIQGSVVAYRPSHGFNVRFLKALLEEHACYERVHW